MGKFDKIIKRNGTLVDFDIDKIIKAVNSAFKQQTGSVNTPEAQSITGQVVRKIEEKKTEAAPTVEQVQDLVEQALMERGFYEVAKEYIIYRYEHTKVREQEKEETLQKIEENVLRIKKSSGESVPFDINKLKRTLSYAVVGHEDTVDAEAIVNQCKNEIYEDMPTNEIARLLVMVTRSFIERDPAYSYVASKLLLFITYREVIGKDINYKNLEEQYREAFIRNINHSIKTGRLDKRLLEFNLESLAQELRIERDYNFKYLGLQTLYDRYFVRDDETNLVLETPQMFWMRIAMGTALNEQDKEKWTLSFYGIMSDMTYTPSTPTLFHSGMTKPQLSSCYLQTVPDSIEGIFKAYADTALLSKFSGGIGMDWTPIRGTGSRIKGTGVESQGVIPFLKIQNDVTAAINRSGKRRGAAAVYLEAWHYDFPDFIELRKNTGDERR